MAEQEKYDLVVIGGGPAGYAGAIRAAQLGKKVACVEVERPGGTCLNWGCIPSKALLRSAEMMWETKRLEGYGLVLDGSITHDFGAIIGRSRKVADQMAKGIEFLFNKNKIDHIVGRGKILAPGMVEITEGEDKGKTLQTEKILVATGCKPRPLPGIEVDGTRVMTSREALVMDPQPKSITVIGAGAIGVEFAYFLNAVGTEVTVVEMLPRVVPVEDDEISQALARAFKKQKIKCLTSTKVEDVQVGKDSVSMKLVDEDGKATDHTSESILVAIGVVPNTDGLLDAKIKLKEERGYLVVDDNYETSKKGIYAAGDIIGPPWLAHVATWEAIQAVNGMFGHGQPQKVTYYPGCTYCQPQIGSVGLNERTAKEKGVKYKVGKFPFTASGKAVAAMHSEGFVKVLVGEEYGEILGAHIIGSEATELIAEYVLAMKAEAGAEDIHSTIHAHPTLSEAVMEAAAASSNEAIHI